MNPGPQLRVEGNETDCRQVLDSLAQVLDLGEVRGPYPNRRDPGVRFYATAVPRPRQPEPGS